MDLKQLIFFLRKWLWLLILGGILGAGSGLLFSRIQSPVYEASTKVLLTRAPVQSAGVQSVLDNSLITQTYMELLTMQPILDATSKQVGIEVNPADILVMVISNTQIIQVNYKNGNPELAALVANTLVDFASKRYIEIQTKQYTTAEENIQAQIAQVESQRTSLSSDIDQATVSNLEAQIQQVQAQMLPLQNEIATLQQEIASLSPAVTVSQRTKIAQDQARVNEITPLLTTYQQIYSNLVVLKNPMALGNTQSNQLTALQSTLTLYNQIYSSLVSNLETIRLAKLNNTSNAIQIEPAQAPVIPARPKPLLYTLLAAFCGLILAGGSGFLIEYLDDTLRTPEDIKQRLSLPILGNIIDVKNKYDKTEILVAEEDHSPVTDSFRSLKNNLEFLGVGKLAKTIIVTSPEQSEGKTTIATNLAVTFAQEGKRVLIIDADLRQPTVHSYFGISNQTGLVDVLSNGLDAETAGHAWKKTLHLNVIPSGMITPEALKLLGSDKMDQMLANLKNAYDVIVLDTPPSFVSDAQAMANKVDSIVLVVRPGYTHRDSAQMALEQFNLVGAKVAGVILNRVQRGSGERYERYHYYSPKTKSAIRQSRRRKIRAFFSKFGAKSQRGRKPAEK